MESFAKLRRRHFVHGESISAIARELNLSRNTVKKYLKSESAPNYQRERQTSPQLGEYEGQLKSWLVQDGLRPKAQRRTARRLYEDLQVAGYAGAYDSVQRYVKRWKAARPNVASDAFVPLSFPAGETCQFDWSHEQVELGGVIQTIKLAHFRLSHSRQPFLVAYPRETQEMVFDAHNRAFAFFGGVPERMVYDNPKTIVQTIFAGKERQFNRRFLALANHYLFEPVACTPASGWEKGQVENQVGNIREWLFSPRPSFADFDEMNIWLAHRCMELARRTHPTETERTIAELFAEEQPKLRQITAHFDGYFEVSCRVSSTCLVAYDRNRYSVPAEYAGQRVSLRAWADRIAVVADDLVVATHARSFTRGRLVLDPWHYLPVLLRKPGALRHGLPFREWQLPASIVSVRDHLMKTPQGDRAFVEVLQAIRDYGLDIVSTACALVVEHRTISAAVILNHVYRLASPVREASYVATTLELTTMPVADCLRYDSLLGGQHAG